MVGGGPGGATAAKYIAMDSAGAPWTHSMMHAPGEMGWAMALGPVAMLLWFGGILSLLVALVCSVAKAQ